MKIAYVRWADASYSNKGDERTLDELTGTTELEEVGFLLRDDKETVTLALENQDGATTSRIWLIIPKVNILKMYTRDLSEAFPQLKRTRRGSKAIASLQPAISAECVQPSVSAATDSV